MALQKQKYLENGKDLNAPCTTSYIEKMKTFFVAKW